LQVARPNQVWCADITYIPMRKGFLYLVAIMDWHTRKVLTWRISNTQEADVCVEALNEGSTSSARPRSKCPLIGVVAVKLLLLFFWIVSSAGHALLFAVGAGPPHDGFSRARRLHLFHDL